MFVRTKDGRNIGISLKKDSKVFLNNGGWMEQSTLLLNDLKEVMPDDVHEELTEAMSYPNFQVDRAKRFQEAITMAYHRFHGVETRIVRIFNTYGPRMRLNDGRVLPAFIGQALRGEDLTVFGDGSQTRSFCYIADLVSGLIKIMESNLQGPVNLGNPNQITIKI